MARFSSTGGGAPGPQGPTGDSAYEIAVNNGFVGTEQEWLDSLAADLVVPTAIKDQNGDDFITFERTGTGTARIGTPQDDLSLRSARDITLFAGSDGPGNVYVGWGDAVYTPNSPNRVATIGDIESVHGDITFEGVKVIGAGTASGDGYGNGTIEIVPDNDLYVNNQYLVIDPTSPNHIHIRAGGTQDQSAAELIFGGEQAHLSVTDYNHQVNVVTYNNADPENTYNNYWSFGNDGILYGPGMGNLLVTGLYGSQTYPLVLGSNDKVLLNGNNGEFLNDPDVPGNQIATLSDIADAIDPVATRWSPTFSATGMTFTGSGATYPTYNSYYVKHGQMVTFNIKCVMSTVTNFGTGQFKLELPFMPLDGFANHFSSWCWVDPSQPADELNGHIQMVADHVPASQTLDLHWLKETTASPKPLIESIFSQGVPVTLTTASVIYVNGTYISAS